ncbi:MAG TPA: magnesium/cobalt transporter CorA [Nitrosopumilaceae archaeon]|nr:magnesium/cobalt transporter CorA [Nitrosopumilaceae archaeon]
MKDKIGLIINRLTIGFIFASIYQIVVGIATSIFSLPLTGNIQDLISGIEKINDEQGLLFIFWWIISTVIITAIVLILVKYKKYISPYKKEKDIDIPPKITAVTAIVIGSIISFLFFLTDLIIGVFVSPGSATDVQAIYEAALNGDFIPLGLSILFSIIAGFIVLGVAAKTSKVETIAKDMDIKKLKHIAKLVGKKNEDVKTTSDTAGLQPGALIHVGQKKVEKITFEIIEYNEETFQEKKTDNVEDCFNTKDSTLSWINISGIHDAEIIKKFGEKFGLHVLVQADIMNTELRPKFVLEDNYIFLIMKMPFFDKSGKLQIEQFSLVIGKNFVLSFQETEGDIFDQIRDRIRNAVGTIRKRKSDYLAYALCDAIVDNFFVVIEEAGELTEKLEEELMKNPSPQTLQTIHLLKREMIILRKSIWPIREVIDNFERSQTSLIDDSTKKYLRDVYSHTIQVMDTIEGLRDMVGGMLDTYLSSVSNRMNEVMKTLTVIASIFIPITFIAGIYGTNFSYIPELNWEGSYFVMLAVMAIIVAVMVSWFRKKQWV